ncbi:MAG: class I SAM-dependent methyltransferase [Candidatus Nanopelagicales bacterium]
MYESSEMSASYLQYCYGAANRRGAFGQGESEGLYRTISDIASREIHSGPPMALVIDFGCGVGRTTRDLATLADDVVVVGLDASIELASTASRILAGEPVECGSADHGWPPFPMQLPAVPNAAIVQADAVSPPLASRFGGKKAALVIANMLVDRLTNTADVDQMFDSMTDCLAPGGLAVVSSPSNWISKECWDRFGGDPQWIRDSLECRGLIVETSFSGLVYREAIDPAGTHLDLPVAVVAGRKP